MSGTKTGGAKASETNRKKYGQDFYKQIGAKGGKNGRTGGFASKNIGADGLTGQERASKVGSVGGTKSRRGPTPKQHQAAKVYEKKVMSFETPVKKVGFLGRFKVGV